MSPSTRLVLSAIAAMINTFLTLPLDVVSSQHAVSMANSNEMQNSETEEHDDEDDHDDDRNSSIACTDLKKTMDQVWSSLQEAASKTSTATKIKFSSSLTFPTTTTEPSTSSSTSSSSSSVVVMGEQQNERYEESSSSSTNLVFHEAYPDESFFLDDSDNQGKELSLIEEEGEKSLEVIDVDQSITRTPTTSARRRCCQQQDNSDDDGHDRSGNSSTMTIVCKQLRRYSYLWKGLTPALLLCSNPSIHYTVYDVLKNRLLVSRHHNDNRNNNHRLSMSQAFVLGLMAKFVATIATYPLIRAKVILMVTSQTSMWSSLVKSYNQDGGIKGLYKGCDWQLIHTLLKSALMMMVRESITEQTHRLVVGPS
jgi:hypothetical protein